jgi:hypothetical protein
MRDYTVKLTQDLAHADEKTRFWSAEAKRRAAQFGLASDCYRAAARYMSMYSNELEALQEELEAAEDAAEVEYNTEYAVQD